MAQALIEEGIENDPSCSVRCIASPLDRSFPIISGMASEVPLGNLSLYRTAKRNAHMLQFINDPRGIPDHDLDGILIAEIIASLDGIEEMPFPLILFLIPQRCGNPALGSPRMRTSRKNLAHHRHIGLAHTLHCCPKSCQTRSHNDDIVLSDHGEPIKYKVILYGSNPLSPPFI